MRKFARLILDEKAATAVEYGLIIALIVIVLITGLANFANATINMWNTVADNVTAVT
jgi:pilus assembly protein Flp/PilA